MNLSLSYLASLIPVILPGAAVTVLATFTSYALALVVGALLALGTRSRLRAVRVVVIGGIQVVRNTPVLIQLYLIYYVLPDYGIVLSATLAGVLGLGLHYSTFLSEVYRAGIDSIPRGQWEAAQVLGFGKVDTWLRVVMPQVWRRMIPPLGNYLLYIYKSTPYLAAVTVPEMLNAALSEGARTFRYVEPIVLVGVVFLILSLVSARAIRGLERHYAR
jgi:polar amino acid transport system permease protein